MLKASPYLRRVASGDDSMLYLSVCIPPHSNQRDTICPLREGRGSVGWTKEVRQHLLGVRAARGVSFVVIPLQIRFNVFKLK